MPAMVTFRKFVMPKKIINEYGDKLVDVQGEIIDNSPFLHMNLYDRYVEVTRDTLQPSKDYIDC